MLYIRKMEDPKYMSESEKANFLKNWEDAKPKVVEGMFNVPIIYGTGGERLGSEFVMGCDPWDENASGSGSIKCGPGYIESIRNAPEGFGDAVEAQRNFAKFLKNSKNG